MSKGIYVTPNKFVSFAEMDNLTSLQKEIASRHAAWDFSGLIGLLPDPDPILAKRGDGVEVLESLTADGHLCSVIQTRKMGVKKREFKFEPGTDEDEKTTTQSEQLCQDFNRDLASIKLRNVISSILDAPLYGMTPIELTFEAGTHLHLKKLEAKPVRWFGFTDENEPRFKSKDEEEEGEKLPWGKFVFAGHEPTYDNPYGLRLLSRCFWPIIFKKGGLKFWVTFMEKYGTPFLIGHYGQNAQEPEQQQMLSSLQQMIRTAVAVVPENAKVEMLNKSGAGGGYMVFDKMKSAMDAEVSKVILGQTLTTEAGEKGSYGLGKVHGGILSDFQESDKILTQETLDEVAAIYAKVNSDTVPAPKCVFYEEEDPKKEFADRDKTLEEGGRVKLKKSYYMRRYGFQDDEFEIVEEETSAGSPTPLAENEPENHTEYAEPGKKNSLDNQLKTAAKKQDELDDQVSENILEASDYFSIYKATIRTWLKDFDSVDDCLNAIPKLFELLDTEELQSSLMGSLLVAHSLGKASVPLGDDFAAFAAAETVWGTGKAFREALDFFKAKSFTIAGHAQADLVAAVKDALIEVMENGGDVKIFKASIDTIFISHGFDPIANHRIATIYRTNMQTAFQAGRYTQLTRPHVLTARPYWRYISVRDGVTRPSHRKMNGKIFRHDNPIWRSWYPPNGFNCRCVVVSLSEREIKRDGLEITETDITGKQFEEVNKETGEVKFYKIEPDHGWTNATGTLERLLANQREVEGVTQVWRETKTQLSAVDLGRPARNEIAENQWSAVERAASLEKIMKREGLSETDALGLIETNYRKEMGISPLESHSVIRSKDGEAVTVTMQALAHAMVKRQDARERFIPYLRHTLEDPFEIILSEYVTDSGKTKYRKKYIGLYKSEKQEGLIIVAEIQKDGSVLWNIMNTRKKDLDKKRVGVKLVYGRN